ncbi:DMT family transporter [Streptomyces sp. NPDC093223]|uniref:DMT family transporter n=1 Tax=Streptomyces sp. NPDC093223 TaxID=3366033 RepID=UPI00381FCF14
MTAVVSGTDSGVRRYGSHRLAVAALIGATAVWGWSYLATAWLLPEMSTASLVAARFVLSGLLMAAVRPRAVAALGRRHFLAGLALAGCLGSGTMLQVQGQRSLPAAQSGFLTSLFVILTPLVARALFKARVARGVWAALAAATAGLAVISFNGVSFGVGTWLTLTSAVCYSAQMALLSEYSTPDKVSGLATLQILGSGVIAALWAVPGGVDLPDTVPGWGWLAYSTLLATLGMYVVQTWAQSRLPAATAAVVLACEPLFVSLFSLLVGVALTARTALGGALIVVAMYLVIAAERRGAPSPAGTPAVPEALARRRRERRTAGPLSRFLRPRTPGSRESENRPARS